MKRAITSGTVRAAAAIAVVAAAGLLIAVPAAAASSINVTQDFPTAPVQATVGDVIDFTLPPVDIEAPQGFSGGGLFEYPMPSSSNSSVLPKVSGAYDADGTLHEEFSAAKTGTATITVARPPGPTFCPTTTSTSSASTSSSMTASSTPAAVSGCVAVTGISPHVVTVVVSATHVEGVVDVPQTGAGGSSAVGFGIALLGLMVTCVTVLAGREQLRRRR